MLGIPAACDTPVVSIDKLMNDPKEERSLIEQDTGHLKTSRD